MTDRVVPWRARPPQDVVELLQRVGNVQLYLVQRAGPTSFIVREEGSEVKRKVVIGARQVCSCCPLTPLGTVKELCLHIIFVLIKVLRVPPSNPLVWQLSLLDRELEEVLRCAAMPERPAADAAARARATADKTVPGQVKRRALDEEEEPCPICYEEMAGCDLDALVWCRYGCGRNVHGKCMGVWMDHQVRSLGKELSCPLCRADWGDFKWRPPPPKRKQRDERKDVHYGTHCGACKRAPLMGKRYHCLVCTEYDLCDACFAGGHHPQHPFAVKDTPQSFGVPAERPTMMPTSTRIGGAPHGSDATAEAGSGPAGGPTGAGDASARSPADHPDPGLAGPGPSRALAATVAAAAMSVGANKGPRSHSNNRQPARGRMAGRPLPGMTVLDEGRSRAPAGFQQPTLQVEGLNLGVMGTSDDGGPPPVDMVRRRPSKAAGMPVVIRRGRSNVHHPPQADGSQPAVNLGLTGMPLGAQQGHQLPPPLSLPQHNSAPLHTVNSGPGPSFGAPIGHGRPPRPSVARYPSALPRQQGPAAGPDAGLVLQGRGQHQPGDESPSGPAPSARQHHHTVSFGAGVEPSKRLAPQGALAHLSFGPNAALRRSCSAGSQPPLAVNARSLAPSPLHLDTPLGPPGAASGLGNAPSLPTGLPYGAIELDDQRVLGFTHALPGFDGPSDLWGRPGSTGTLGMRPRRGPYSSYDDIYGSGGYDRGICSPTPDPYERAAGMWAQDDDSVDGDGAATGRGQQRHVPLTSPSRSQLPAALGGGSDNDGDPYEQQLDPYDAYGASSTDDEPAASSQTSPTAVGRVHHNDMRRSACEQAAVRAQRQYDDDVLIASVTADAMDEFMQGVRMTRRQMSVTALRARQSLEEQQQRGASDSGMSPAASTVMPPRASHRQQGQRHAAAVLSSTAAGAVVGESPQGDDSLGQFMQQQQHQKPVGSQAHLPLPSAAAEHITGPVPQGSATAVPAWASMYTNPVFNMSLTMSMKL